jgi:ABC-type transporter Mla subunit MlaD
MAENDFLIKLDTAQLEKDAHKASLMLKNIGNTAEAETARIDNAYRECIQNIVKALKPVQELEAAVKTKPDDNSGALKALMERHALAYDQLLKLKKEYYNDLAMLEKQKDKEQAEDGKERLEQIIAERKKKYNEDEQNALKTSASLSQEKYKWEADRQKAILETQKKAAETLKNELENNTKAGKLVEEINRIEKEIENLTEKIKNIPAQKFGEMLGGLQKITGALGKLDGELGKVFTSVSTSLTAIDATFKTAKKEEKGFTDYADLATNAATGMVEVINMLTQASAKRKQAEKDFYKNSIAYAHEYALALNEVLLTMSTVNGNGFVTNYEGRINDSFNAITDANTQYQETLGKLYEGKAKTGLRDAANWGSVSKGAAGAATAGAAIGTMIAPGIGTAIGAVVGGIGGAIAGIFGGKKKKEEHSGLLDVFPKLIDANGELNEELAQTLIKTNQLDDNTKQLLQNTLNWAEALKKSKEQMHEITQGLAGDLGNSIHNALKNAWETGQDGSKAMFDSANKSLEDFIDNMIYGSIMTKYFDTFKKDFDDAMNDGVLTNEEIIDAYGKLADGLEKGSKDYKNAMNIANQQSMAHGNASWMNEAKKEETRTASAKGLASASQESIYAMSGIWTNIEYNVHGIHELMKLNSGGAYPAIDLSSIQKSAFSIQDMMKIQQDNTQAMLGHVGGIHSNTEHLGYMREHLRVMQGKLDNINDGINAFTR